MTLIVSLRTPDGIVLAGDSLLTLMGQGQLETKTNVACPQCNHQHEIQQTFRLPAVPATTFSYAQKVLPFYEAFGVGTFGAGLLADKSIYFAIRLLEQKFKQDKRIFTSVTEVAKEIGRELHNLLAEQLKKENASVDSLPEHQLLLGVQVVGYDGPTPKTVTVDVGKNVQDQVFKDFGCSATGSREIVDAIWELYGKHPSSQPPYPAFSLQDAIDYAEFLIRTTIGHQRFAMTVPNVGGDIDIALVTPFDGFQWIRRKSLGKILGGKRNEPDSGC